MSTISTHVLDTARGRPAGGVPITLERQDDEAGQAGQDGDERARWHRMGGGTTDDGGRVRSLLDPGQSLDPGTYRMTFDTGRYFASLGTRGFYPVVHVIFEVRATDEHYHVPLLLSPYGYSTYRGS